KNELLTAKDIIETLKNDIEDLQLRLRQVEDFDPNENLMETNVLDDLENDEDNNKEVNEEDERERVLSKKKSKHERFFSTYNVLAKLSQNNTGSDVLVQQLGQYDAI